jgi:hypothetical protein
MRDVDAPAIFGTAFAEEALQVDMRLVITPRTTAERQQQQ